MHRSIAPEDQLIVEADIRAQSYYTRGSKLTLILDIG